MPSYYDSTKQKPGKAKRIYRKGGIVKMQEGRQAPTLTENQKLLAKAKAEIAKKKKEREKLAKAKYDHAYKEGVYRYTRRSLRGETDKDFSDKVGDWARKNIGERFGINDWSSSDDKALMQARKDILGFKKGGKVKKVAHGGKVTRSIDGRATKGLTRGSRRT